MTNITGCIEKIYNRILDEESRFIYVNRLNYSLTRDTVFLQNIINGTVREKTEWKELCVSLKEASVCANGVVMFGAGIWGRTLYGETKDIVDWKYVVDSSPKAAKLGSTPVIAFDDFIEHYSGEYITVSSYKKGKEMIDQLLKHGVSEKKIIDAGSVIYELTEKAIYFDLEELLPIREKEVFVDAGSFDGFNSKSFYEWCGGNGFAYCFEPESCNIKRIKQMLGEAENYEIVPKALWRKTTDLKLNAKESMASSVAEMNHGINSQKVEAVSLDEYLAGQLVTFIKMDIEGAELEALKGAENIIKTQRPRLAICVYHKLEDIWTIPCEILKYYPDYRFYLRHYSFHDYDTVLYAIP